MSSTSGFMGFFNRRPYLIALLLSLVLIAWMASGEFGSDAAADDEAEADETKQTLPKVRVQTMKARPIQRTITLYGRTEPDRFATLKAETKGRITEVMAERGSTVRKGDPIVRIAMQNRRQRLAHAKKLMAQKLIEFEGARKLSDKGYQGKVHLAKTSAELEDAKAMITLLELDIENTIIRAPFDGVLAERYIEVGDYLAIADPAAMVVDLDPLIVRADVTQADVSKLGRGQSAEVRMLEKPIRRGEIRYLASIADENTNTFRVEVALDNADFQTLAGMSAELNIALEETLAIRISPALLALNETGDLGVKWVDKQEVRFTPIDLVKSDAEGAWITGLGEEVTLITVGQAFVREGDRVEPVFEAPARQ